ncbi:lysophosphatidiate acyltransferase [Nematocida minor]|uniref:lysophosphatidiate acyltransferase n=1 Tax=Nematocida minor TaxID=1912983 RepID=UPI0022205E78|nr:lysophosphatidiate acyltransferase [Nematocida minor]KAI5192736.1 lysophosphatidiate acyltransferase [Nematocida minor]
MSGIYGIHALHKSVLSFFLGIFLLLLLVIEIVTFPVAVMNRRLTIRIMNWYNKTFTRACIYILKIGNKTAVEMVDLQNNPVSMDFNNSSSVLIISNHICALDTILLGMVSNSLGKNARFIAKDGLKWLPILGWGMYLSDYLFIKRIWRIDSERIKKWCFSQKTAISLIIYPEGTRYTEAKRDRSARYSRDNNLPVFTNVLYPRIKGYNLCMSSLQNPPFTSLLNVTIVYLVNGKLHTPPSIISCLTKRLPGVFRIVIEKEDIVKEAKNEKYLIQKFQEKDKIIERYKTK